MRKLFLRYYIYGIITLWAVVCFVFFQFYYSYYFYFKEQNQIFLMSWDYISTYFRKPAWMACIIGDFLTQFYYYMYLGSIIITVTLLTMGDLIRRCCEKTCLKNVGYMIALILMTVEAFCHFDASFQLSSTIAIIGGAVLFLLYRLLCNGIGKIGKFMIATLFVISGYWMFGYGCIVFIVFSSLYWYVTSLTLLPVILFIILMRSHFLLNSIDCFTYPGLGRLNLPNMQFEKLLEIDNEYYFGHYNRVVYIVKKANERTPQMLIYYNMALAQNGSLPDELLTIQPTDLGTFHRINENSPKSLINMMNELYYLLGDMTFTERAAMMANVFSPHNRNIRMIKRLAEVNLVTKDTTAAIKYLRILDKTIAYHKWAKEHTPGSQNEIVKDKILSKQMFVNVSDSLRMNDNCRTILTELLCSNPKNVVALDYLLCSDLIMRDFKLFKMDYDRFYEIQKRHHTPAIYTQAIKFYNVTK